MDLQECEELSKRNVGNWATDVLRKYYCTKLPLSTMRALAGFNVQRGFHENKRSTFFEMIIILIYLKCYFLGSRM